MKILPNDFFKQECKPGRGGWSQDELKKFCVAYNLPKTGNKMELCDRLTKFLKTLQSSKEKPQLQLPPELEIIIFKKMNTLDDINNYALTDKRRAQIFKENKKRILLENDRLEQHDLFNWIDIMLTYNQISRLTAKLQLLVNTPNTQLLKFIKNKREPIDMHLYKIYDTKNDRLINIAIDFYQRYFFNEQIRDEFNFTQITKITKRINDHLTQDKHRNLNLKDVLTWMLLHPEYKKYVFDTDTERSWLREDIINFDYPRNLFHRIEMTDDKQLLIVFLLIVFRSAFLQRKYTRDLTNFLERNPRFVDGIIRYSN